MSTNRYRLYLDNTMLGPFDIDELLAMEGFGEKSTVCEVGDDAWQPAVMYPALHVRLAAKFGNLTVIPVSAPRGSSAGWQTSPTSQVSTSGDFISPNNQFVAPSQTRKVNDDWQTKTIRIRPSGNIRSPQHSVKQQTPSKVVALSIFAASVLLYAVLFTNLPSTLKHAISDASAPPAAESH